VGTIAVYAGILLLLVGAPLVFLMAIIAGFWQRHSMRRDLLEYYRSDAEDEPEVRECIRQCTASVADHTDRLAGRVLVLIPVGWVVAAILYLAFGQ
jgi:hypothetical protein